MTPVRGNENEAGFTLLELLVSLVLTALLMAAVPPALKFAGRGVAVAAELDRRAHADAALAFVEQRLSEATAIYGRGDDGRLQIIFKGEAQTVSFVAPLSFKAGDSGFARYTIGLGNDSEGHAGLLLTWSPWRPAPPGGIPPPAVEPRSRLIVSPAIDLGLKYYGAASATDDPQWSDDWQRTDALPDMVEFKLTVAGGTRVRRIVLRLRGV